MPDDLQAPWLDDDHAAIVAEGFQTGFCFEFAVALHVRRGWPMYAICEEMPDGERCLYHAVAQRPDGLFADDEGAQSREALLDEWDEYRRDNESDDCGRVVIVPVTMPELVELRDECLYSEVLDAADGVVAAAMAAERLGARRGARSG